ncbi:MAG: ArsR/SmtB family transcription factor [Alphaproteobacteria bacterium]
MIMTHELEHIVDALKAAGDPTRLRLLGLCRLGDMSVGDLVDITGQSQPSISRHLKILHAAGLLERRQDGAFVFYRLSKSPLNQALDIMLADGPGALNQDKQIYAEREQKRHEDVAKHFALHAADWDDLRGSYLHAEEVDGYIASIVAQHKPQHVLDIGTGTGHILNILGRYASKLSGVDISRDMLSLARQRLGGVQNADKIDLRRSDMNQLPFDDASMDMASMHLVLRHASNPRRAIMEASRVLKPQGHLIVVDLEIGEPAGHHTERSGFAKQDVCEFMIDAGLVLEPIRSLTQGLRTGYIWHGVKQAW